LLLKRSQTGFAGQNHTNLSSHQVNIITTKNDPLLEQKLALATEGLEPHFLKHLKTKVSHDNALTISKYILSMRVETSLSTNYRRAIISSLKLLSEFLSNTPFSDMTRDDVISFLGSLRKAESEDVMHKWIGSYNLRLTFFARFFKWLYYQNMEPSKRPKPHVIENIPFLKRKERSIYKPSDLWTTEDDLLFLKYCPSKRMKCFHAMSRDTSCRPHELLKLRIRDVVFKSIGDKQYAEVLVNGKTGSRHIPLINSLPYIKDSLKLSRYKTGIQLTLFPTTRRGYSMKGEDQDVDLEKVSVVLMNPPFTKVERGISTYVDMKRFGSICGNEIGLWGHFISLADEFLEENGVFGGVIPINILRGRETGKIREFVLSNWTLLYVIKPTINYGFSEWSEYRDILIVAKKVKPPKGHKVKFALLKRDLQSLHPEDIRYIANRIELTDSFHSEDLDIESFPVEELFQKSDNLMWFCGVSDMKNRDRLVSFIDNLSSSLQYPTKENFKEGFRPFPKGASSFLFLTRNSDPCRKEEAFLFFDDINKESKDISLKTNLGTNYQIEKSAVIPTLRTPVGIKTMDITDHLDYLAITPYKMLDKVIRASGFTKPENFSWKKFWLNMSRETNEIKTHIIISCRINPYSPNSHLTGFYSLTELSPSDQMKVIKQSSPDSAMALCVVINSIIFLSQFFLLKEESTGRYIHIRLYDLKGMMILPDNNIVMKLCGIFNQFASHTFPSLREQLDTEFHRRYKSFWLRNRKNQKSLFEMDEIVNPSSERLAFDKTVCDALNLKLSENEIRSLYTVIINEMIITQGLKRD
jgi:integrase